MVQEYEAPQRLHKHTFEMVMAAYERRFPRCPQIPVVVECITLEDTWSVDHSNRNTVRRAKLTLEAPYLIKKMAGVEFLYFIHRTHLDLKARILDIDSVNETFSSKIEIIERCKYFVNPENPEWTCFDQMLSLEFKNLMGLESTAEKIALKQYAAMNLKGKDLIESFMQEVHNDGIFELAPWSESTPHYNGELRRVISRGLPPTTPSPTDTPQELGKAISPEQLKTPSLGTINRPTSTLRIKSEQQLQSSNEPPIKMEQRLQSSNESPNKSEQQLQSSNETPKEGTSKRESFSIVRAPPGREELDHLKFTSMMLLREKNLQGTTNITSVKHNPCRCDIILRRECLGPPHGFTDWDSLLIILVCAFIVLFALMSPLNFIWQRPPNRQS